MLIKNKKMVVVLLSLLLLLMTACSAGNADAETAPLPEEETPAPTPERFESGIGKVVISEVMSKNKATIQDSDGDFSDWIELENIAGEDVSLFGWTISDGNKSWQFPEFTLYSNSRAIVFASKKNRADTELHTSFAITEGDSISLLDRNGDPVDSCIVTEEKSDWSLILDENLGWSLTSNPTPGYENTDSGYEAFISTKKPAGPVIINEVCVDNYSDLRTDSLGYTDWVEIRNISAEAVDLSEYYISDDTKILKAYALSGSLEPGEVMVVLCDKNAAQYQGNLPIAPFSLNSENERLYLSNSQGRIIDFVSLKTIPYDMTSGRVEGKNGLYILFERTPGKQNSDGIRSMPKKPKLQGKDGIYNGVESVTVELEADGDIYYTLDSTVPTTDSIKYTAPITLTETTIVRAINVEGESLTSDVLTLSYIINENHTLPVASLVCGSSTFWNIYRNGQKDIEVPGNIAFYEKDGSFNLGCGVKLNGASSLVLNKKNLSLRFRGSYGAETLEYDFFGGGVTSFTNLVLRAGQDQNNTIVRNEACYQIAREFSDKILTLRFKYCILYLDGKYNGIYAFIEKPNEAYAASTMGVSKDSTEVLEASVYTNDSMYTEVFQPVYETDMREDANYQEVCRKLDVDSLIDWTLAEGFLGNYDLASGNLRYARSTENDGKWRVMMYDLDCSFSGVDFVMNPVIGFDNQVCNLNRMLLKNETYRTSMLKRASEAFSSVLTQEHMVEVIEELCTEVEPEVDRDKQFSGMDTVTWRQHVDGLENMIIENNWTDLAIDHLCRLLQVSPEERMMYFGEK